MDQSLRNKLAKGDNHTWRAFLEEWGKFVYSAIYSVLNNRQDTLDCYQEVLLRIQLNVRELSDDSNFRGWVKTVALNQARKHRFLRQELEGREFEITEREMDGATAGDPSPAELAYYDNLLSNVKKIIRSFPGDRDVRAFTLNSIYDYSFETISALEQCSIAYARTLVSRGRKKVRDRLLKRYPEYR